MEQELREARGWREEGEAEAEITETIERLEHYLAGWSVDPADEVLEIERMTVTRWPMSYTSRALNEREE